MRVNVCIAMVTETRPVWPVNPGGWSWADRYPSSPRRHCRRCWSVHRCDNRLRRSTLSPGKHPRNEKTWDAKEEHNKQQWKQMSEVLFAFEETINDTHNNNNNNNNNNKNLPCSACLARQPVKRWQASRYRSPSRKHGPRPYCPRTTHKYAQGHTNIYRLVEQKWYLKCEKSINESAFNDEKK